MKMTNIKDLRDELLIVLEKLKNKEITVTEAVAYGSVSSKVIQSAKVELEYNQYTNQNKRIDFLETP